MGVTDKSEKYNTNLLEFIEFTNMLQLSEVVILSALKREESRGAHYRSDYPHEVKNFAKKIVSKNKKTLQVEFI